MVQFLYKYSAHLNFTMIFDKKKFKPSLSYLPCTVRREYFNIIFNVLYSINYGNFDVIFTDNSTSHIADDLTESKLVNNFSFNSIY
jgi:hypothetical protein